MKERLLITAALPYANGPLHFGHLAGAYLPADCYARFARMQDKEVLFICGTDEYGVAITLAADLAKRSYKEHVDLYHDQISHFFQKLEISFDHFSRTTTPFHPPIVQQFFNELVKNGYVEKRETEELYSEQDQKFLADRYVVGECPRCHFEEARGDECLKCGASYEAMDLKNPRSKISGSPLIKKKTSHYFLLFDKFKEKLKTFIESRPWKANVLHFAQEYIDQIRPRAITRDLNWGVKVPGEANKVFYVWFDAPIGYITATMEWAEKSGNKKAWERYWLDPQTRYVQFMGKDNIPFHALFFPAMVMGQDQGYKLVDDLVANEFYQLEGRQFSKSEGWYIDLKEFFNTYHADQIRYMIAATAPETGDSEFTWKEFQMRCNAELLGKLGNFVNRVLVFIQNHTEGIVPKTGEMQEIDERFHNDLNRYLLDVKEAYSNYHLRKVTKLMMEFAHIANTYFDFKTPWKEVKESSRKSSMETTLSLCVEAIRALAVTASPIIPQTAQKIWEMIGMESKIAQTLWKEGLQQPIERKKKLSKPYILFAKIENEAIAMEIAHLQQRGEEAQLKKEPPYAPLKPEIGIEDFQKVDLRVGLITKAEKVAKSKKLLQLEVDLGSEKRTILSGISEHYTPEQLIHKKVIVVANLKPAKLMGIESQGMVLAGSLEKALELATILDLPAGAQIT